MKTRIEFYENDVLFDVREWPITPMEGLIVELMDSADDTTRTVVVLKVVAAGHEDGFKYMLICQGFKKWQYDQKFAAEGSGRTG